MEDKFGTIRKNLSVTTSKEALIGYSRAALGGALYPVIPTAIEAIFKTDLTGWKGFITGSVSVVGLGMILGWDDMVAGAVGAATAHLLYAKGNESVHKVAGKYLFRFDPTQVATFADPVNANGLQPGATPVRTPDGRQIAVYRAGDVDVRRALPQPESLNGYNQPQPMAGYNQPQPLSGYNQPQPLAGYDQPQGMADNHTASEFALDADPFGGDI